MAERAVLVGVTTGDPDVEAASLEELERLAETAGAETVAKVVQRRERLDPATLVGSGKVAELRLVADRHDADLVVFDNEITPAQERNLAERLGRRVLDRTALILDIFAQHAESREGRLQVELAQLSYLLPRLRGRGVELSRLGGGIGTRGPGETKLEVDRRRIQRRIARLRRELTELEQNRRTKRERRARSVLPIVAVVGYTNAGKSSVLNAMTGADVRVADQLFATLDPTTRRCELPGGRSFLMTDTVGFVNRLPHQLVEAFRSTLELVVEADVLLHVVDVAADGWEARIDAVRSVLAEIGAEGVPELLAGNKVDVAGSVKRFSQRHPDAVVVSALTGAGIDELRERLWEELSSRYREVEVVVPFGPELERLHETGEVLAEEYRQDGVHLRLRLPVSEVDRIERHVVA